MNNTILQQGNFTSTGAAKTLAIRSDVDWMWVYNLTQGAAAQATARGVAYYWQRGFATGAKWTRFKSNSANAADLDQYITSNGFSLIDSSANPVGALNGTITAISAAAIPVVTLSAPATNLSPGDIVRIINVTSAQQLGGFDFTIGYNTPVAPTPITTTFSLDYMSTIVAGTTGSFRKIIFDPLFYPRSRFITKITSSGSSSVVTTSVTHGYKVGQKVRFTVPFRYGMVQMNNLLGTITAVDTATTTGNTFTVNINSSAFTAFAFPVTANVPFTPAVVVPVGEDTAQAITSGVDLLNDSTNNTGLIGMQLAGGVSNPAGVASDEMYWVAGKSFSVDNTI